MPEFEDSPSKDVSIEHSDIDSTNNFTEGILSENNDSNVQERNNVDGNKGFLGDGWMRLLEFDIENDCIHVKTYSTEFNEYELDENSDFIIDIDFEKRFWK